MASKPFKSAWERVIAKNWKTIELPIPFYSYAYSIALLFLRISTNYCISEKMYATNLVFLLSFSGFCQSSRLTRDGAIKVYARALSLHVQTRVHT